MLCLVAGTEWSAAVHPPVVLRDEGGSVTLSNGRIEATLSKAHSTITSLRLGQHQMVAATRPVYYSMGGAGQP